MSRKLFKETIIDHERYLMFNPQGLGPTNQIATSLHPIDRLNNTVLDMTGPFIASCKTGLFKSKFWVLLLLSPISGFLTVEILQNQSTHEVAKALIR